MSLKLSQIVSGGAINPATDQLVAVRSGANDVLVTPGSAISLDASDPSLSTVASVSGSITLNHFTVFADGEGTVKDGGVQGNASNQAASSVTGTVAAVNGGTTAGHMATFTDTAGTIQDGGAVPTLSSLGGVSASTTVNGHALSSNVVVSATDITTGTLPAAQLPLATTSAFGAVKPDGTTITIAGGIVSASASGSFPFVAGTGTVTGAAGTNSVAIGNSANAIGDTSLAFGNGAEVNTACTDGIAIGNTALVTGGSTDGIAIGSNTVVGNSGASSDGIAIGNRAICQTGDGIAIGYQSIAEDGGVAIGAYNSVSTFATTTAIAIGRGVNAGGAASVVIGTGLSDSGAEYTTLIGNTTYNLSITPAGQFKIPTDTTNLLNATGAVGNGAGSGAGTILTAPTAGEPAIWAPIVINGVTYYMPLWS